MIVWRRVDSQKTLYTNGQAYDLHEPIDSASKLVIREIGGVFNIHVRGTPILVSGPFATLETAQAAFCMLEDYHAKS